MRKGIAGLSAIAQDVLRQPAITHPNICGAEYFH